MKYGTVFLSICLFCSSNSQDPCGDPKLVPNIDKRDKNFHISLGDQYLNDHYLTEQWYKTPDIRDLLDSAPGFQKCGTLYPIWRRRKDQHVSTMCIQDWADPCFKTFNITTAICGTKEIYQLKPSEYQSAYCFAWPPGKEPPIFDEKPVVEIKLVNAGEYQSELVFHCTYNRSLENVFYSTAWNVDGRVVLKTDFRQWGNGDLIENHALNETQLKAKDTKTIGFQVRCEVRASYGKHDSSRVPVPSDAKFVGVNILSPRVLMEEGESTDISLQLTAPFGCGTHTDAPCLLSLELLQTQGNSHGGVVGSACGAEVAATNWNSPVTISVTGRVTPTYGSSSALFDLELKTSMLRQHHLWSESNIGTIRVQVMKNTTLIEEKECYAVNDPHMRTFDGRLYEHQYPGTFTLYKHTELPIEVQIQTIDCLNGHNAFCLCGAAVRAGRTIFEFNRCVRKSTIWNIAYTFCKDGVDVLQVRKQGSNYKIYLPTGGYVAVNLAGVFLNVHIFPSVKDIGKSAGLCGNLSDVCSDDFVLRDGSYSTDKTSTGNCGKKPSTWRNDLRQFSDSWKVDKKDDLFLLDDHTSLQAWPKQNIFCSCASQTKISCTASDAHDNFNYGKYTPVVHHCTIKERRKRSTRHFPMSTRLSKRLTSRDQAFDQQQATISQSNDWSEDKARTHCVQLFQQSKTIQVCDNVPGVESNSSIDNCIFDILLTGTTSFSRYAVDTVRSKCLHEVFLNPDLQKNETSSKSPSVFDMVVASACPNDCSEKGKCTEGACDCHVNYGGVDCSVDLTIPPILTEVENDGHCDLSRDTCHSIVIYGQTFIDNKTMCIIEEFKVTVSKQERLGIRRSPALVESISSVQCILRMNNEANEHDDPHYVRAYRISVANIAGFFSNAVDLMVYDGTCIKGYINETTFSWSLKGPFCLYMRICIPNGASRPDDICRICHVSGTSRSWLNSSDPRCIDSVATGTLVRANYTGIASTETASVIQTSGGLAGTTKSIKGTGTTRSVEVTGTTISVEGTGTTKSVEGTGTTKSVELTGTTKSVEGTVTTTSVNSAETTKSVEGTGTTKSVEGTGTTKSVESTGTTRLVEVTRTTKSVRGTGTTKSVEGTVTTKSDEGTKTTKSVNSTGTTKSVEGTGTTKFVELTRTTKSVEGTEITKSVTGTGTTRLDEGTVTTKLVQGSRTTKSVEGTVTTNSFEGTGTTISVEGTGTTRSVEGAGTTTSVEGAGTTTSVEVSASTKSDEVTGTTKSVEVTGTTKLVEVTATPKSVEVTGTTKLVVVTGTTTSIEVTGTTKLVEVTDTTKSVEGTGTTKSVQVTGTTKPVQVTGTTKPVEGTGTAISVEGTGTTRSIEGTETTKSVEGTGATRSFEGTGSTKSVVGTERTKSVEVTGTTISVKGAGTTKSVEGTGTTKSVEGTGTTISVKGTGTTKSVEVTGTTKSVEVTGTTISVKGTGTTKSVEGTGTTKSVVGTSTDTTKSAENTEITQSVSNKDRTSLSVITKSMSISLTKTVTTSKSTDSLQTQDCGRRCHNGGVFVFGYCHCTYGFSGKCCDIVPPSTPTSTAQPATTERLCQEPLWESGVFQDTDVTSSSNEKGKTPEMARSKCTRRPCGWCPDPSLPAQEQYLEVNLDKPWVIQAIEIQPPEGTSAFAVIRNYMTNYTFQCQPVGGTKLITYGRDQLGPIYMLGVRGSSVTVVSTLTEIQRVIAQRFRISVVDAENKACFRFKIFGCKPQCDCENGGSCLSKNTCLCPPPYYGPKCHYIHLPEKEGCLKPLGMWNKDIKDDQLVVSSSAPDHGKNKARYICCGGEKNGAWCPASNDTEPYYEVKLSKPHLIAMLMFEQPNVEHLWQLPDSYMKTFNLQYHNMETGNMEQWAAHVDAIRDAKVSYSPILDPYLFTDVIKIIPDTWEKDPCFRFEVIGCDPDDIVAGVAASPKGLFVDRRKRGVSYILIEKRLYI